MSESADAVRISASVTTADPELIARAVEVFARAATGLALEQREVSIFVYPESALEDDTR